MARKLTDVEKAERLLAETIAFCKVNGIKPARQRYHNYDRSECCAVGAILTLQGKPNYTPDLPLGIREGHVIRGNDYDEYPDDCESDDVAIGMALGRSFQDALREG